MADLHALRTGCRGTWRRCRAGRPAAPAGRGCEEKTATSRPFVLVNSKPWRNARIPRLVDTRHTDVPCTSRKTSLVSINGMGLREQRQPQRAVDVGRIDRSLEQLRAGT